MQSRESQSWGRYPHATPHNILDVAWPRDVDVANQSETLLAYGLGRSYGDVCLNDGGTILRMSHCDRVLGFDTQTGRIRAESGLSIADLLAIVIQHGWFVPVTPGTKYVTLGGAVANDIHGKNHHRVGTFGCHVVGFEVVRSDGSCKVCTQAENSDLFAATIGGLGLTGLITWVEIQLQRISSRLINEESLKVGSLKEVVAAIEESDAVWDYTVSWIDVTQTGAYMGRGLVLRGAFSSVPDLTLHLKPAKPLITIPMNAPQWLLSRPTIRVFNSLWYNRQQSRVKSRLIDLEPFFYPLDSIAQWNLLYGKRGMLQYQCVVPSSGGVEVMHEILKVMQRGKVSSFLAVVKKFGNIASPGLMSFPIPGLTLTLDMPKTGQRLFETLDRCDELVLQAGGRVYAAKDARVRGETFRAMYPQLPSFIPFIDPAFSSSFWRRIQSDH